MKLTENDIKQIYFYCKNDNPDGVYHNKEDELDIIEFGTKLSDYVSIRASNEAKKKEHKRCVELVRSVNPSVADFLESKKEYAE
jgi:hypothetical protein